MDFIELRDVRKTYRVGDVDVSVLRGVTLNVARGEMVALMGASGSGKSTLMNILGCLDRPTSGEYRLDGEDVTHLSTTQRAVLRNRKIGFVFQNFNLLARTTSLENAAMPLMYAGQISESEAKKRAGVLLERVGLGDRFDHHPTQLSGGQQQRVALARALINHPPLLFADEPTGNLDSHTSQEILQMLHDFNKTDGVTIVLVTHEPDIARYAQRVIHLRDGVIA